jgi:hypothetical protein
LRNLIGQAQLRCIESPGLRTVIDTNNRLALSEGKYQYLLLLGNEVSEQEYAMMLKLRGNPKLTPLQALNLEMNLQIVALELAKKEMSDE